MNSLTKVSDVLALYGVSAFKTHDRNTRIDLFEGSDFRFPRFVSLAEALLSGWKKDNNEFNALKHWMIDQVFYEHFCQITDLPKWKQAFDLKDKKIPFPDRYLTEVFVYGPAGGGEYGLFSVFAGSTNSLAKPTGTTVDDVRFDFYPPYRVSKIFQPEQARENADKAIRRRIAEMEVFLQVDASEQLIDDLMTWGLRTLQERCPEFEKIWELETTDYDC